MKISKIKIILLVVMGSLFACDYDLDKVNPNNIPIEEYYSNVTELTKGVNATYAVLQSHMLLGREWIFAHDMRDDDFYTGGGQLEVPRAQLLFGVEDAGNFVLSQFWQGSYGVIHRANIVLEKGALLTDLSENDDNLRSRLYGEVRFLRAWAYYELVTKFGGVPIYDAYIRTADQELHEARATEEEVYAQIAEDLNFAINNLPKSYGGGDLGRVTKYAARALLARLEMWRGDYDAAYLQLDSITVHGGYSLVADPMWNWDEEHEYNSESVFEVGYRDNYGTGWGAPLGDGFGIESTLHNQEYNPISWGNAVPSRDLIALFDELPYEDPREDTTFYVAGDVYNNGNSVLTIGHVAWQKHSLLYKAGDGYHPGPINERVIRYAEVLLMKAECAHSKDAPDLDEAMALVNEVRARFSSIPQYGDAGFDMPTTSDDVFMAIALEKRLELCGEEIRATDMMRWRHKDTASGKYEMLRSSRSDIHDFYEGNGDRLFSKKRWPMPIPQSELDRNINISQADQNPGY